MERTHTQPLPLAQSISAPALQQLEVASSSKCPFATQWMVQQRPVLQSCAKLTRRQLRLQNRSFAIEEVALHHYVNDAWIAVDGHVYDITEHLANHDGWGNAGVTTPLSILAHAGTECSAEFHAIHRTIPVAYKQLAAFAIGPLAPGGQPPSGGEGGLGQGACGVGNSSSSSSSSAATTLAARSSS